MLKYLNGRDEARKRRKSPEHAHPDLFQKTMSSVPGSA
jgi:hypothetical protein